MCVKIRKTAAGSARGIDRFTSTTLGKVVGLTPCGIKVNGRPGVVEEWPWEKAIPNASKVIVVDGKETALIEKCKELGGQACIFAMALESARKRRAVAHEHYLEHGGDC